jgi:putative long chain acyl-CoA synthase
MKHADKIIAFAQNATEVVRYGGLQTDDERSPYEVTVQWKDVALRRYFPGSPAPGPAMLLVHPLMMSAEMWDVSAAVSCVHKLHASGIDPWVIDFGRPEMSPEILERTLSDLVVALNQALEEIIAVRGEDVFVAGYSQGGMLAYQVAAYRESKGLAGVVSFGSPVDFRGGLPEGVSPEVVARVGKVLGSLGGRTSVPGWLTRNAFRVVDPVKSTRKQLDFLLALHDRDALLPREGQRRFIDGDGWLTAPGPALAEFAHQFIEHNRMLQGGIVVNGVARSLADVSCPMLAVMGDADIVASAPTIRPLREAAPNADTWEAHVGAGHLGLVLGARAQAEGWPAVIEWVKWVVGEGPEPVRSHRIEDASRDLLPTPPLDPAEAGADLGKAVVSVLSRSAVDAGRNLARNVGSASVQARRLARLSGSRSDERESLALTLDERAGRNPAHIQFLYQGTAVTRADAKLRIDAVSRGLMHIGVSQGDHVGVLMGARPSAVSAVAAINRIGAISVMLRAGQDVMREAALGEVSLVVCDPERVDEALATGRPVWVLGGGSASRPNLPDGVRDLEAVDPDTTQVPAWYQPNPGRGGEVAFILFTDIGEDVRVHRITNHRWVLSAYGTAAAASLGPRDTVYCLTPPSHPSGLLVSIGGAIAGDARFAMADEFDPDTFWEEVRRYGVTVVSYTWSMLQELVDSPPRPAENNHPIRLFVGSGMPPALWQRVLKRFKPAGVVGFYTAPGEAVLVNLGGAKVGSLGRPLPGASRVRIVRWDLEQDAPVRDNDGWVVASDVGEPGMLLAEVSPSEHAHLRGRILRSVLSRGDNWLVSGDLATRDEDGDIWWIDAARRVIAGTTGRRSPNQIRDVLEGIDDVATAVVYPVAEGEGTISTMAAVELQADALLKAKALDAAFADVDDLAVPDLVRVVDRVPRTLLFRTVPGHLPQEGVPGSTTGRPVWRRNPRTGRFQAESR